MYDLIDCLAMKDRIQEEIYEEIKDLSVEEQIAYYRRKAETGPLAEFWKRIKAANRQSEPASTPPT